VGQSASPAAAAVSSESSTEVAQPAMAPGEAWSSESLEEEISAESSDGNSETPESSGGQEDSQP